MAKEILVVPEEKLSEVIAVIRAGLEYVDDGYGDISIISDETREQLEKWCKEELEYLEGRESISNINKT